MPAHLDQGNEGSCGPNTLAECIGYEQKVGGLPVAIPSRQFIYWYTRYLMGTVSSDSGVDNRTMLKAAMQYGFCPETLWPYDVSKMVTQPPPMCLQAALPNRIVDYSAVLVNEIQMKGCIASGNTFIFGFDVYPGMMTDACAATGLVPMPKPGETPEGGHDITAYDYDDAKQLLRCRNHWVKDDGTPWGDDGDALVPYAYAFNPNWVSDLWTVKTIPGENPLPVPGPVPIVPPPGPIPIPIPIPPGPGPMPTIQQLIDAFFASVEAKYASIPFFGWAITLALEAVRKYIDTLFAQPQHAHLRARLGEVGAVGPEIMAVVDAAFAAAIKDLPALAPVLMLLQQLTDAYLPLL